MFRLRIGWGLAFVAFWFVGSMVLLGTYQWKSSHECIAGQGFGGISTNVNGDSFTYAFIVATNNAIYTKSPPHVKQRLQLCSFILGEFVRTFNLSLELIVVEWDPPAGVPRLADAIDWHPSLPAVRIIEVSGDVLASIPNPRNVTVQEYIGKNVGARRARSKFLWFGSTDNIFNWALGAFLARRQPKENEYYARPEKIHCEVVEEPFVATTGSVSRILKKCVGDCIRREKCRLKPEDDIGIHYDLDDLQSADIQYENLRLSSRTWTSHSEQDNRVAIVGDRFIKKKMANTMASGDFLIVSTKLFHFIHGYMETPELRRNIDSSLFHQLVGIGLKEITMELPMILFHHLHDLIPASAGVNVAGELNHISLWEMIQQSYPKYGFVPMNTHPNWGLADKNLKETVFVLGERQQT